MLNGGGQGVDFMAKGSKSSPGKWGDDSRKPNWPETFIISVTWVMLSPKTFIKRWPRSWLSSIAKNKFNNYLVYHGMVELRLDLDWGIRGGLWIRLPVQR